MGELTEIAAKPGLKERLLTFGRTERYRWVLVWFLLLSLASVRAAAPSERDPYWSARAGWENLTGGPLAPLDTWSWTKPGEQWFPNSPAWNWLLGASYHFLGFWGLYLVAMANMALFFWLAWKVAVRIGARPLPGLLGMAVPLMLVQPMLSARATLFIQSLFLIAVLGALKLGEWAKSRNPGVAALVVLGASTALCVVGNWVHLSFLVFGWALMLLWAVMWWFTPGLTNLSRVAMGAAGFVGALVGVVVSPYGWSLGMERSRAVQEACTGLILEWTQVWVVGGLQWWLAGFLVTVFSVWVVWLLIRWMRSGRRYDESFRIVAALGALGVPTGLVGWTSIRFLGVGLIAMLPLFALAGTMLADMVRERREHAANGSWMASPRFRDYTSGAGWVPILSMISAVLLVPVLAVSSAGARPPEMTVIGHIPQGCTVLAEGSIAGPIILTRPDLRVSIDGRADFYGRAGLIQQYRWVLDMDEVPANVGCVVLRTVPQGGVPLVPLAKKMKSAPGWDIWEADGYAVWTRT